MDNPTLTEIAADLRKHAPDAITDSVFTLCGDVELVTVATKSGTFRMLDREKVARACLIAAMVMDIMIDKFPSGWRPHRAEKVKNFFATEDFGGDDLITLWAAWKWARGIK